MKHPQGHPDAISLKNILMRECLHGGVFAGRRALAVLSLALLEGIAQAQVPAGSLSPTSLPEKSW
jgi:hypothetical protein